MNPLFYKLYHSPIIPDDLVPKGVCVGEDRTRELPTTVQNNMFGNNHPIKVIDNLGHFYMEDDIFT